MLGAVVSPFAAQAASHLFAPPSFAGVDPATQVALANERLAGLESSRPQMTAAAVLVGLATGAALGYLIRRRR